MTNEIKTQIDKACVILAGAGTGKSFIIKQKAKYLVEELKYNPEEILCLTFSNEATNSLKKGMQEEINSTENINVKTFHAFCSDILRERGQISNIWTFIGIAFIYIVDWICEIINPNNCCNNTFFDNRRNNLPSY